MAAFLALPGAASAAVNSDVTAGALSVASTAGDAIAITCDGGNVKVNGSIPDGVVACTAITEIDVTGDAGANNIDLNGVTDELFTALTSVAVDGAGGNDTIAGSEIADTLAGGSGHDRLVGFRNPAGTRDVMTGGEGDDTLVWNPGDGNDTMDGEAGYDVDRGQRRQRRRAVRRQPRPPPGEFSSTGSAPPYPVRSTSTSARPRSST